MAKTNDNTIDPRKWHRGQVVDCAEVRGAKNFIIEALKGFTRSSSQESDVAEHLKEIAFMAIEMRHDVEERALSIAQAEEAQRFKCFVDESSIH